MKRLAFTSRALAPIGAVLVTAACMTWIDGPPSAKAPSLEGFGELEFPITTSSSQAQALFVQGMLQAYAFNESEAVRAFQAALRHDAACAMCEWGIAYALGPNINARAHRALDRARRHVQRAHDLGAGASLRERELIAALRLRYADAGRPPPEDAPLLAEACGDPGGDGNRAVDRAYVRKLQALADARPDDADVASLLAEAVMIATPGPLWDIVTGEPAPDVAGMVDRLERALRASPRHTGANHYLVHAMDRAPQAARARASADALGALAPASPHLVHMPSHLYVRLERYADARRVNEEALAAERRLADGLRAQGFDATRNWDTHNQHFLWFGALMEGRGEQALAQARELQSIHAASRTPRSDYLRSLPALTLLRLERWDEAMREAPAAHAGELELGLHEYAHATASLRLGRIDDARRAAQSLDARLAAAPEGSERRDEYVHATLEIARARLQGDLLAQSGDAAQAQREFARAIALEDAHRWYEPPMLAAGSRLALADALLRAQRWAEAEAAFRDDLAHQPGSGWALRGLQRALSAQGRNDEAASASRRQSQAWLTADAATLQSLR